MNSNRKSNPRKSAADNVKGKNKKAVNIIFKDQ